MKLWLISQSVNDGYDTYDSAVVAAETVEQAQATHPGQLSDWGDGYFSTWARSPAEVTAVLIGDAVEGTQAGVVCASFNAG
jgi:hypothetical protein